MSVELVIARYNEDLKWLDPLHTPAMVYNKGRPYTGQERQALPPDCAVALLPNVGREAHTYLTHIVHRYDSLADWTVFVQGDPGPHISTVNLARMLVPSEGLVVPGLWERREWGEDGRLNWSQVSPEYKREIRPARKTLVEWFHHHLGIGLRESGILRYVPGACFGVPKRLIQAYPKDFYTTLLAEVSDHIHPEEAHYLERAWVALFTAGHTIRHTDLSVRKQGIVYACQPCYGSGNKQSKKKFWAASVNPVGRWAGLGSVFDDSGGSLLAESFNAHWKTALNMQLAGKPVLYFAMLHDDIVPEDFWLDKLLDELERTGADIISAVVPIKDARGLTSIAIDDPDDPWATYRRLTMKEVHGLPETFTAQDCLNAGLSGGVLRPLLLNTGCWACRMDRPWRHKVHFEIHNAIAFVLGKDWPCPTCEGKGGIGGNVCPECNGEKVWKSGGCIPNTTYQEGMTGAFVSQVMSEDWDFSRQLARLGCDVRATRKVSLSHMSEFPFPNYDGEWGKWETDQSTRCKWDPTWKDVPREIRGWLSEPEGRLLAHLATGRDVLEIGSFCGLSTVWMARTASSVVCVDTFDGRGGVPTPTPDGIAGNGWDGTLLPGDTYEEFRSNLRRYEVEDKVTALRLPSGSPEVRKALKDHYALAGKEPTIAFIDGSHDYESVKTDTMLAALLLAPNGLLVYHDYKPQHYAKDPALAGVARFVNDLVAMGARIVAEVDSIAVVSMIKEGATNGERQAQSATTATPTTAESATTAIGTSASNGSNRNSGSGTEHLEHVWEDDGGKPAPTSPSTEAVSRKPAEGARH